MEVAERIAKGKEESVIGFRALYKECNKNQWFTCGSCEQYDRMFELESNGITIDELAAIIYICSNPTEWNFVDILDRLIELNDAEWIPEF